MTKSAFARTAATLVCTIVMSATCLFGAVAPAHVPAGTVAASRPMA